MNKKKNKYLCSGLTIQKICMRMAKGKALDWWWDPIYILNEKSWPGWLQIKKRQAPANPKLEMGATWEC
jgi:hypothetical protein